MSRMFRSQAVLVLGGDFVDLPLFDNVLHLLSVRFAVIFNGLLDVFNNFRSAEDLSSGFFAVAPGQASKELPRGLSNEIGLYIVVLVGSRYGSGSRKGIRA